MNADYFMITSFVEKYWEVDQENGLSTNKNSKWLWSQT
jgi:hypothetical protein